jgi:hypothetical protein
VPVVDSVAGGSILTVNSSVWALGTHVNSHLARGSRRRIVWRGIFIVNKDTVRRGIGWECGIKKCRQATAVCQRNSIVGAVPGFVFTAQIRVDLTVGSTLTHSE